MTWSSMTGFVDPVGLPSPVDANGQLANHIIMSSTAPDAAATRSATPRISAAPMPSRPSMNSQLTTGLPAMELKKPCNGPESTPDRNPLVGDPPSIQARALGVA